MSPRDVVDGGDRPRLATVAKDEVAVKQALDDRYVPTSSPANFVRQNNAAHKDLVQALSNVCVGTHMDDPVGGNALSTCGRRSLVLAS